MDDPHFTARTCLRFLFLILLQTSVAAELCSGPRNAEFAENNDVGHVIATFIADSVVTIAVSPSDKGFSLENKQLKANKVFDLEGDDKPVTVLRITCTGIGSNTLTLEIVVTCLNINDNPPVFTETVFNRELPEMTPVGTTLGPFGATDPDGQPLSYTLTTAHSAFRQDPNRPYLIVQTLLDYDKIKSVQMVLEAVDKAVRPGDPVFTATATINFTIVDVDNRPPWFQPCTPQEIGVALVCQSPGYTGRVVLNEQEDGVLPLKPGPILAIDGDVGINEQIKYSFLGGDAGGLFAISETTGDITMTKPADVLGTISLTVLAAQRVNTLQIATAPVSISVQVKSLHPPKFQKPQYDGVISSVGSLAVDSTGEPLQILATDDDYETTGGFNPDITYSVTGSSDFSIINGYLFMTKELPEGTLSLEVVATDTSNDEKATALLSVEVKSGTSTTPPPTTDPSTSPPPTEPTTNSKTTVPSSSPSLTTDGSVSTAIPTTAGDTTISTMPTSDPSMTSEGASTAHPPTVMVPSGGYRAADMAALGATLGVLLFISTVTITVLAIQVKKGKSDWRKIYETSMFRSTLGQGSGGPKDAMQYTNEAFDNDGDGDGDDPGSGGLSGEILKNLGDLIIEDAIEKSIAPPPVRQGDDTSLAESDKTDDKEVKPILTKERRMEPGYKAVWFKEDIDPNAKEEVEIIQDEREEDSEEEEDERQEEEEEEDEEDEEEQESSSKEENEDNKPRLKARRGVVFNDTDLDSGLGVKIEDPAEDSESGEILSYDL